MRPRVSSIRQEMRLARQIWCDVGAPRLRELRALLVRYKFSIILGEITRIDSRWYVTHSGLIRLASRRKCSGITTFLQERLCDPAGNRWVFRAVVHKGPNSKGFVGYGDADPSNTSSLVRGTEMRSPKREPSIVLCAKLTALVFAQSRSSGRSQSPIHCRAKEKRATRRTEMTVLTANPDYATTSAF